MSSHHVMTCHHMMTCHHTIRDPGPGTRDLGSGIRDPGSGSGIRDPGSGIRDPGSGIRDPGILEPGILSGNTASAGALKIIALRAGSTSGTQSPYGGNVEEKHPLPHRGGLAFSGWGWLLWFRFGLRRSRHFQSHQPPWHFWRGTRNSGKP